MHNGTGVGTRLNETPDPRQALPPELREALDREIDPGESLRWCGQPDPRRIWIGSLRGSVPVALACLVVGGGFAFGAVSVWREMHAAGDGGSIAAIVVTLGIAAFFLVLAALAARQPWSARAEALRTIFAVTNTRVFTLVLLEDGRVNLEAFEPSHPLGISRTEDKSGTGTIALNPGAQVPGARSPQRGALVLVGVREPRVVERLIRQTFDPPGVK